MKDRTNRSRNSIDSGVADGMPMLSRGQHLSPRDGACLMETVSVLAGERWSDRPRCTHPALAQLARLINDSCPPEAYPQLVQLVPDLIQDHRRDPRVTPALVLVCLDAMRRAQVPDGRMVRAYERSALRRLSLVSTTSRRRQRWYARSDALYRAGPAYHAMAAAIYHLSDTPAAEATRTMTQLLRDAIRTAQLIITEDAPGAHVPGTHAATSSTVFNQPSSRRSKLS